MRARLALLVGAVLVFTSCVSEGGGGRVVLGARLVSFTSCDDVLSYVRQHGLERVTAWGLPGQYWGFFARDGAMAEDASVGGEATPVAAPVPGVDYSTTNLQTVGVDEPDIVKTDGRRLLALAQGKLFVVDVTGDTPALVGSLTLGDLWVRDLLLVGDRALLLGETGGGVGVPRPLASDAVVGMGGPISALVEVDLTDQASPTVARRLFVDGSYLSARMIDGIARVVVSSYPTGLEFTSPQGPGLRAERDALEHNREVIEASTIDNWVPYFVLEDGAGGTLTEGTLLDCDSARHPEEFSGFGMLTVLTLDLTQGLDGSLADRSVGIVSDGQTVYASTGSLYVATQQWIDWWGLEQLAPVERAEAAEGQTTQIHRFDLSDPARAEYRSSGQVPGWLLNQFSMDEYGGYLRVASTESPPFWGIEDSESMVTTLTERDGRLVQTGQVAGLGEGERIFAVRFMGERGYVVTFRQVDPLYVVDLSDPTSPAVTGELKIRGYSAYLHPIAPDRLLGVGQDATGQGALKGTQLSLFDVSDPTSPRRIGQVQIGEGSSEAEWDHHAFLYWEPSDLVVVPLNVYRWNEDAQRDESFYGAQAVRIREGELTLLDRLSHQNQGSMDWGFGIRRSLVIGNLLYTVSEAGVEAADLGNLDDVAWIAFR
jgi:uncharacterized secreted protein with C-terminal beta-propeller domain